MVKPVDQKKGVNTDVGLHCLKSPTQPSLHWIPFLIKWMLAEFLAVVFVVLLDAANML